jgi:1A family penicillin-binding protein
MARRKGNRRALRYVHMARRQQRHRSRTWLYLLVSALFGLFLVGAAGAGAAYAYLIRDLPAPEGITERPIALTTKIYDRNGELLNEIFDPKLGKRTWVPLSEIPQDLINATIATEDADFYRHQGVNFRGLLRAAYLNLLGKGELQGGSSITQQLVKNVLIPEQERQVRSIARKVKEVVLALEISRRYPKKEILEMYLNEIYYGNFSYGVEAAAQSYFGKSVRDLTLAECALLAGLPQAPSLYSPLENLPLAKRRQADVLDLMVRNGYITEAQAEAAKAEELRFAPRRFPIKAPHFVMYVRDQLEKRYGRDALFRGGLRVYTTLDLKMQETAERIVREHVAKLKAYNASNAALVALRPQTGEILAMVGSADFFDPTISGQVNVALAERQPGSSFKPFTYLTAFMKGYTPATMLLDIPSEFPNPPNPPYKPENVDGKFRGPILIRQALANSVNIPAVKTLQFAGVQDVIDTAHRMGITTLNRKNTYGLSLTLGGGEVKLLDMAYAYSVFANGGVMKGTPVRPEDIQPGLRELDPVSILRVEDRDGKVLEEFREPQSKRIISPQLAYLITDILSDNQARAALFGPNSVLKLPSRPAAVKTGTTDDWRDTWTVGYTPDLVTGVWVGNSNNKPMRFRTLSVLTAAPIWHEFMETALAGTPPHPFPRPSGLEEAEVCADSGLLPTPYCPKTIKEIFLKGTVPRKLDDMHRPYWIDRRTGGLATLDTPPEERELKVFTVLPPEAREWAEKNGIPQPPEEPFGPYFGGLPPYAFTGVPPITGTRVLTPSQGITGTVP